MTSIGEGPLSDTNTVPDTVTDYFGNGIGHGIGIDKKQLVLFLIISNTL